MKDLYKPEPLEPQPALPPVSSRSVAMVLCGLMTIGALVLMFFQPLLVKSLPDWCFEQDGDLAGGPMASLVVGGLLYVVTAIGLLVYAVESP